MMTPDEAKEFTSRWLPAWSGNRPAELAAFYADDAFFLDPGRPQGICGKEQLLAYFTKVTGNNPTWTWTLMEAIPIEEGFLGKLAACIPVGNKVVECVGLCFLQFGADGKIKRNEIYFDRTELIMEINKFRQSFAH
ncbi:MAG: nuclear transport factor 2 family protein [Deltaproteobacteria bacterium]|nr:nuclear transport factor 2 family protein [Deltaproteobacteria bacterium]